VANYEAMLASVKRRVALRDASALEEDQARAALGRSRAGAAQRGARNGGAGG
jgi:hypothetical protein